MTQATVIRPPQTTTTELTSVEIDFYSHEILAGDKLIAKISYDHDDFNTQRWIVEVNGEEIFRHDIWARCYRYICTHWQDGSLPEQEPEPPTTTGNEIMCEIAEQCEIFGLELLDDGVYCNNEKLGEVGQTNGRWWYVRADSSHRQKVASVRNAVMALSGIQPVVVEGLLDKPFDQLTTEEWRMVQGYKPVRELVAA